MRMIPPQPTQGATGSEVEVFRVLANADFGGAAIAFSSLNLSEHEYKKWGEIDFVVLCPEGLLVLEVKGGQVHCDERGIWRYESRGKRSIERAESPMAQASSAYFALRDRHLYPSVGRRLADSAVTGFGVILARTSMRDAKGRGLVGGTEMPAQLIGTREDITGPAAIEAMLARFLAYWRGKRKAHVRGWDADELATIAGALRPWFDRVPPLSLSVAKVREEQLSLTQEQYQVLDFSDLVDRMLCTGGAGCGKTLLAIECLRREMARDPVLVTGTNSLAAHLRASQVPDPSRVYSFQELLLSAHAQSRQYGCLIVDEGQQITNGQCLGVLAQLLRGGLEDGRWRWFSDPNNQVLSAGTFDWASHEFLRQHSFPGVLRKNCRNTPQIVQAVEAVTAASVGISVAQGSGPEVEFASSSSSADQISAAARTIQRWLEDPEIAPGDIVLLSPRAVQHSSIPAIANCTGIPWREWSPGWSTSADHGRCLAAATVDEFRGLEAPFVVLCDIDQALAEPARVLYLGMTRANFGLFVGADHDVVRTVALNAAATRSAALVTGGK